MIRKFLVGILAFCLVCISASYTTALADTGAELFEKLTCHSCHGPDGRGMVRMETKENYRLSKKVFKQLLKSGIPRSILKQMKPLYKKKFDNKKTFVTELKASLGQQAFKEHSAVILEAGGKVYYRKGDVMKGFENYPRLSGNKEIYLFNQMKDILEGRRINGSSDAMRGIQSFLVANKITDKVYRLIARYLSKIKRK